MSEEEMVDNAEVDNEYNYDPIVNHDLPEGIRFKSLFVKTLSFVLGTVLFYIITFTTIIDSWDYFGFIFMVNLLIKVITFMVCWILFDLVVKKKFRDQSSYFTFDTHNFIYSFIYTFFALVLITTIYLFLKISFVAYNVLLLYIYARILTTLFCSFLAHYVSRNSIAVVLISIAFGIVLTVCLFNFLE